MSMPASVVYAARIHGQPKVAASIATTFAVILLPLAQANADDPDLQDFFFNACADPAGALAARCAETNAGLGDVSGASESSLNPSQTLAANSAARAAADARGTETRAWGESAGGESTDETGALSIGPFSVLLNGQAISESFDSAPARGNERRYDLDALSVQLGIDYRLNRSTVTGAWLDWRSSSLDFDREPASGSLPVSPGEIDTDGFGAAAFASMQLTPASRIDAALGYTTSDYDIRRRAVFEPVQAGNPTPVTTLVETAAATEGSHQWATLNWTWRFEGESWGLDPFIGLTWSSSQIDDYEEQDLSGSGLAMQVSETKSDPLIGTLGFDAQRVFSLPAAVLIPQLHFEYSYGFDVEAATASTALLLDAGNNRLNLRASDPDRDFAQVGGSLLALFPHGWSLFVDARTTIGLDDVDRYAIAAGLRIEL